MRKISCFLGLFSHKLQDVFTPTSPAKLNYVCRKNVEDRIKPNLLMPGKQIVLFGPSGSGKTTVIQKLLNKQKLQYIITHCDKSTTYEDLLCRAFDDLNMYYIEGEELTKKTSGKIEATHKLSAAVEAENQRVVSQKRIIDPQHNAESLCAALGRKKLAWIIEDFHKMKSEERALLADALKIFIDGASKYPETRMICVGVAGSAYDLLSYDANLRNRIAEIEVPLLSDEEINQLIKNGCKYLNVYIAPDLVNDIIKYSARVGTIAHQMCYDMCYQREIMKTQRLPQLLDSQNLQGAIESYVNNRADTFKYLYEGAIKNDIGWYILRTISISSSPQLNLIDIWSAINQNRKKKFFTQDEVRQKLEELSNSDISILKYDSNTDQYSFTTPIWQACVTMRQRMEYANKEKKQKKLHIQSKEEQMLNAVFSNFIDGDEDLKRMIEMYNENHKI